MAELTPVKYDESKEMEIVANYYNCQIIRVNTVNPNLFLEVGKEYDKVCISAAKADPNGRCRMIFVVDKIPPLTAILKFVSAPFNEVQWGIYAIVVPPDMETISKVTPILSYALGITELRGRYTIKVFGSEYRNKLDDVISWIDSCMEIRDAKIDVKNLDKIKAEMMAKRKGESEDKAADTSFQDAMDKVPI